MSVITLPNLLLFIAVVLNVLVSLHTVTTAASIAARDLQPGRWDVLALTMKDARWWVRRWWWLAVRRCWWLHLGICVVAPVIGGIVAQQIPSPTARITGTYCPTHQITQWSCLSLTMQGVNSNYNRTYRDWVTHELPIEPLAAFITASLVLSGVQIVLLLTTAALGVLIAVIYRPLPVVTSAGIYLALLLALVGWIATLHSGHHNFWQQIHAAGPRLHERRQTINDLKYVSIQISPAMVIGVDGGVAWLVNATYPTDTINVSVNNYKTTITANTLLWPIFGASLWMSGLGALCGAMMRSAEGRVVVRGGLQPRRWGWVASLRELYDARLVRWFTRYGSLRSPAHRLTVALALLGVITFAAVGRWVRFDNTRGLWVGVMVGVVLVARAWLIINTLIRSTGSTQTLMGQDMLLRIAPIPSGRIIFNLWLGVTRGVWVWWLLTGGVAFGAAYAVTQYLGDIQAGYLWTQLAPSPLATAVTVYEYQGGGGCTVYPGYSLYNLCHPTWDMVLQASVIIGLVEITGAGFVVAVGITSRVLFAHSPVRMASALLMLSAIPILPVLGLLMVNIAPPGRGYYSLHWYSLFLGQNITVLLTTLLDGGMMLAANLMRPTVQRFFYRANQIGIGVTASGLWLLFTYLYLRLAARRLDRD